ncbi:S-layer homology domain-containing protein [Paenibacillus sp. GYB004]|uniref:S-layer homology domain-containing protein n=1 Tax=Paenibacillus sp. GYB004 TaxID=2994393 RepID=UPI002F96C8E3
MAETQHKRGAGRYGIVVGLCMFLCLMIGPSLVAQAYEDVEHHWAAPDIRKWMSNGYADGYPDGTFQPDRTVSRAEMASFLFRIFESRMPVSGSPSPTFSDWQPHAWYAEAMQAVAAAGYMNGYEDGSIRPDRPVTRQEAAVLLVRLTQRDEDAHAAGRFHDPIPEWSKGAVGASAAAGWMHGYEDGSFRGEQLLTRAEAVTLLNRLQQALSGEPIRYIKGGTYGPRTGSMDVAGDVIIDTAGVTLQNIRFTGNVIVTDQVGEGEAVLDHVQVDGYVHVQGGGENSIHLRDSTIAALLIEKTGDPVRVVASGRTTVASTMVNTSARLVEETDVTDGFRRIDVGGDAASSAAIKLWLSGRFDNVDVLSPGVVLLLQNGTVRQLDIRSGAQDGQFELDEGTTVEQAVVRAAAGLIGQGEWITVELYANRVRFERTPVRVSCGRSVYHSLCTHWGGESLPSSPSDEEPDTESSVTKLAADPLIVNLQTVGETAQVILTAHWSDGTATDVTQTAEWSSSRPPVANVNSTGLITAAGTGQTTVEASYAGFAVQVPVQVTIPPAESTVTGLTYSPLQINLQTVGETAQVTLTAHWSDGTVTDVTQTAEWSSSHPPVANVNSTGLVTAAGVGQTTVEASYAGFTVQVPVQVTIPPAEPTVTGLTYSPLQINLQTVGETAQVTLTAHWSDGTVTDVTQTAEWSSSHPPVANVNSTGLITAAGTGQTTVEASYAGFTVQVPIEIVLSAYTITPALSKETPVAGEVTTLLLTVIRSDGLVDSGFSGLKTVRISGFQPAPDGTFGQWDSTPIPQSSGSSTVLFTEGVGRVALALHRAEVQSLQVSTPDSYAAPVTVTVTPIAGEAARAVVTTQPLSGKAVEGKRAIRPVISLVDAYGNLSVSSGLMVTAKIKPTGSKVPTLVGDTTIYAENGIARFDSLALAGLGDDIVLTFQAALLDELESDPFDVKPPFAGNGTAADPYQIDSPDRLNEVRYYMDAHYRQTADIDFAGTRYQDGDGWYPIGEGMIENGYVRYEPFTGTYDGGGFMIRNLIGQRDRGWLGLFGMTEDAALRRIHLVNVQLEGVFYVGGLVGMLNRTTIEDSSVQGSIAGTSVFGGLAGYGNESGIIRSDADVRLSAIQDSFPTKLSVTGYIGGLVGGMLTGTITDTYAVGQIVTDDEDYTGIGGLVGYLQGFQPSQLGKLERSYARIEMEVRHGTGAGGLVGINSGATIHDAYAAGSLHIGQSDNRDYLNRLSGVGGLVGWSENGSVTHAYAAATLAAAGADEETGGLVGRSDNTVYESAYYDSEVSGHTDTGKGSPLGTETMRTQTAFLHWEFGDVWSIIEGCSYPYLSWQPMADLSCYQAGLVQEGTKTAGVPFEILLTETRDAAGHRLNKNAVVTITWKEGNESLFSGDISFADGEAQIPVTVHEAGRITLFIQIAHIQPVRSVVVTVTPPSPVHPFAGGSGTEADPYMIQTAGQLDSIRHYLQSHFKLGNDIDLNVAPYNQGEGWKPIGSYVPYAPFEGSLDGGGHTISGLTINRPSADTNAGLFGLALNSVMKNLHLKDVQIASGGHGVGGLAGTIWYGTVENVSVQGTVKTKGSLSGGVVGDFSSGTMRYVYADIDVEGEYNVGGLVGVLSGEGYGAKIERSYSKGAVRSIANSVGGLAGWLERDCIIIDSYSLAEITGNANTGGLVGNVLGEIRGSYAAGKVGNKWNYPEGGIGGFVSIDGNVTDSYYDRQTTTRWDTGNGEPLLTADMKKQSTFANWDFTDIWSIDEGNGYPALRWPD